VLGTTKGAVTELIQVSPQKFFARPPCLRSCLTWSEALSVHRMDLIFELELNGCALQGLEAAASRPGSSYCDGDYDDCVGLWSWRLIGQAEL